MSIDPDYSQKLLNQMSIIQSVLAKLSKQEPALSSNLNKIQTLLATFPKDGMLPVIQLQVLPGIVSEIKE